MYLRLTILFTIYILPLKKIVQFDWLRENRPNDLTCYFHDVNSMQIIQLIHTELRRYYLWILQLDWSQKKPDFPFGKIFLTQRVCTINISLFISDHFLQNLMAFSFLFLLVKSQYLVLGNFCLEKEKIILPKNWTSVFKVL